MQQMATDVWRLASWRPLINVYLVGDVLIDTGRRQDGKRILAQLDGRPLGLVALTHAHADHQGSAHEVCEVRGVPLACHADDVEAMEGRASMAGVSAIGRLVTRRWGGPPHPVDRVLREGDDVAGFRVVHAPGHAPGEVVFFRESDGVAICGDVIRNVSYATMRTKIFEPPDAFNDDTEQNRASIRKLAELGPSLILPGHGDAVRDMSAFERFVSTVPGGAGDARRSAPASRS